MTASMNINTALEKVHLIPSIIPQDFYPMTLLEIIFPSDKDVALGNRLSVKDVAGRPKIHFVPPEEDAGYTLILADFDAPSVSDPSLGPWRHWVVTNIQGSSSFEIKNGTQHTPYIAPLPESGTGEHRYVFLLYQQSQPNTPFQSMQHDGKGARRYFDTHQFAAENGLELISVNYFLCSVEE
ncbi:phosphatidylethanolamine-binding protein [Spinellus fusiger]|nr:phosphatidylethanolamine-binding protein [Spinellus fusiger]